MKNPVSFPTSFSTRHVFRCTGKPSEENSKRNGPSHVHVFYGRKHGPKSKRRVKQNNKPSGETGLSRKNSWAPEKSRVFAEILQSKRGPKDFYFKWTFHFSNFLIIIDRHLSMDMFSIHRIYREFSVRILIPTKCIRTL